MQFPRPLSFVIIVMLTVRKFWLMWLLTDATVLLMEIRCWMRKVKRKRTKYCTLCWGARLTDYYKTCLAFVSKIYIPSKGMQTTTHCRLVLYSSGIGLLIVSLKRTVVNHSRVRMTPHLLQWNSIIDVDWPTCLQQLICCKHIVGIFTWDLRVTGSCDATVLDSILAFNNSVAVLISLSEPDSVLYRCVYSTC